MSDDLQQKLKSKLKEFWVENMGSQNGEPSPFPVDDGMDSVTAVHVLCDLETIAGVEKLPTTVIRSGGYRDEADFVSSLSQSVAEYLSTTAAAS